MPIKSTDLTALVMKRLVIVIEKYFYPYYLACLTDFVCVMFVGQGWGGWVIGVFLRIA